VRIILGSQDVLAASPGHGVRYARTINQYRAGLAAAYRGELKGERTKYLVGSCGAPSSALQHRRARCRL